LTVPRRPLVLWHRWFGLLGALWLFMMAATGSVLVFYEEIDHALNRDLFTASAGPAQPADRLVTAALAGRPDQIARYVDLPNEPGDVAHVYLSRRPDLPPVEGETPAWEVMVDPATAQVLGARDRAAIDLGRRGVMSFVYEFHYSLHLGEWMIWVLGLVAFLWLIDHLVSAVLSFPNPARWRESFRIRRSGKGYKRVFDLHRAVGLWLFPVTLVLAVSGVYFNWYDEFKAVVNAASPLTPRPDEERAALPQPLIAPPLSFDDALARVVDAPVDGVAYNAEKGLYWVRAFDSRDIDPYGRRWIFVDARDGRVLSDTHSAQGSAGDVVMAWQFPLHSGKAFGWPGRIAIFLTGIATCMFIVTGLMMWVRKRSARAGRKEPTPRGIAAEPLPAE
jgi:uncharacterized iron-regulated membrane protein